MRNRKIFIVLFLATLLTLAGCSGRAQDSGISGERAGDNPASPPQLNQSPSQRATALGNAPANVGQGNLTETGPVATLGSRPVNPDAVQPTGLQQKLASVSPDGDGSVTVTISDDELTQAVAIAQTALVAQGQPATFQNAVFTFGSGQILFSSTVNSDRFSGDGAVVFTPYLSNNVLQLELVSATVNGRPVPPVSLQPIEATINAGLEEAFRQLPPGVSLDAVTVQEGVLIITGSVTP